MENKELAVKLIKEKLNKESFLSYIDIATITNYHPKYILRLKKEILEDKISLVHGNKFKKPANAMSSEEEMKIVNLYKRFNGSIRRFCRFYNSRSYSCIYNVLKKHGLIKKNLF